MSARLKVLIVDDSVFFRNRIASILASAPDIEVVGSASNGREAVESALALRPDVITMDVEMPVEDGISAVRRIMSEAPTRILMFSALTQEGAKETLDALEAGALDFLAKEVSGGNARMPEGSHTQLLERIRAVGHARLPLMRGRGVFRSSVPRSGGAAQPLPGRERRPNLVAIGASTGGPVALRQVLSALPRHFALPLAVAVHMPGSFTKAYAERLNGVCAVEVREASDRDPLKPGQVLLAPGGRQMSVERGPSGLHVRVSDPLPGQIYHPSVDLLLGSVASSCGGRALAVVMTGMGSDGLEGAKKLKAAGAALWSQDEKSCVVYGMPQAVERAGLSDRVVSLDDIGPLLAKLI